MMLHGIILLWSVIMMIIIMVDDNGDVGDVSTGWDDGNINIGQRR